MSDLICEKCGIETTYADAAIFDAERTCLNNEKHNWSEK